MKELKRLRNPALSRCSVQRSYKLVQSTCLSRSFFVPFLYVFPHRLALYCWGLLVNKLSRSVLICGRKPGPRCTRNILLKRKSYSHVHNL